MKPYTSPVSTRFLSNFGAVLLALGSVAMAHAGQVYRIVGPDGKVTFSDRAPLPANKPKATEVEPASASGAGGARLPFELAKVARQFPVVLYTSKDCAPCNTGRNQLTSRGIPFAEKTVENAESIAAFKQLTGQASLPLLTIGSQQLKGYSDATWTQYLSAAGYPEKSALPSNFKQSAPVALAEAKAVEPANAAQAKPAKGTAETAPAEIPVSPASSGIRF